MTVRRDGRIFENEIARTSRAIEDAFWSGPECVWNEVEKARRKLRAPDDEDSVWWVEFPAGEVWNLPPSPGMRSRIEIVRGRPDRRDKFNANGLEGMSRYRCPGLLSALVIASHLAAWRRQGAWEVRR